MTVAISQLSRSPRDAVAPAGLLVVALGVGVVTGATPMLGVALAAALVFALIVMWDLTLGVCLFLLITFLDVVSRNQNLSLTKGAGAVLAGSWLATMATGRGSRRDLTSHVPWLTGALVAFLAWSAMSAFWAESPSAASRSTFRFALDVMLIPIVFWAVRERKHVVWLLSVFIVGTLLSVLWGLTQGKVSGGADAAQGRLTGATVEANELATLLVVCFVFAIVLAVVLKRAPMARGLAVVAALAGMAAFFGTFSRAGLIALGVVILAGGVYSGKARSAFLASLVIGVVVVGAVFLQNTSSGAVQRLTSSSTSGRSSIWKVGLRMVRANPIIGVGSGNYAVAEPHYFLTSPGEIPAGEFIIDTPYQAHNIYLQAWAEMGVIGLALFLSVIVLSIRAAVKAVTLFRASGEQSMEILGRALVIALAGILAADFFAPDQYSKQLWLLLALGPALLALARRSPVARSHAPPTLMAPGPLAPSDPERQR